MELPVFSEFKTISVIGAGGKTSLCLALTASLPQKRVFTTSTHIFVPDAMPSLENPSRPELREAFEKADAVCVYGRAVETERPFPRAKVGAPDREAMTAVFAEADHVVIEADGARGHLLKAHGAHEPVILPETDLVLCVANMRALGKTLLEAVHRTERIERVFGKRPDERVTEDDLVRALAVLHGMRQRCCAVLNCVMDEAAGKRVQAALAGRYGIPCLLIPEYPADGRLTDRIALRLC